MAVWIKAAEAMALLGITKRWLEKSYSKFQSRPGAKKANGKCEREILLESMPEGAQLKYWERKGEGRNADSCQPSVISRQPSGIGNQSSVVSHQQESGEAGAGSSGNAEFDALPEFAKKEALRRFSIINGYEEMMNNLEKMHPSERKKYSKTLIIKQYAEKNNTDEKTLYRWIGIYNKSGRQIISLAPKYGKLANKKELINEEHWKYFLSYYLTENQLSFEKCYRMTANKFHGTKKEPTFRRELEKWEAANFNLFILCRYGDKYYKDHNEKIIRRTKDGFAANEAWVGDERTIDIRVLWGDGTILRPKVTMWQDVRSNKIVGYVVERYANSDTIAASLRIGFLKNGVPVIIYTDNGKDYICKFFTDEMNGFLKNIGITPENHKRAIYHNARAKQIERKFKEDAANFDKAFSTYIGGNIAKRPECEIKAEKQGRIVEEKEFRKLFDDFVLWYNNRESQGEGMNGRTPNEVWVAEYRESVKRITDRDLAFLMLRNEGERTISRGEILFNNKVYTAPDLYLLNGRKVTIKRDLFDEAKLAIYSVENNELLSIVEPYQKFKHFDDSEKERIGAVIKERNKYQKELHRQAKEMRSGNESISGTYDYAIITENRDMTKLKETTIDDLDRKVSEMTATGAMSARLEYEKKQEEKNELKNKADELLEEAGVMLMAAGTENKSEKENIDTETDEDDFLVLLGQMEKTGIM